MSQNVLRLVVQKCTFKVDYTLENIPGREFGSVFVNNNNVALKVVSDGWAKVKKCLLFLLVLPTVFVSHCRRLDWFQRKMYGQNMLCLTVFSEATTAADREIILEDCTQFGSHLIATSANGGDTPHFHPKSGVQLCKDKLKLTCR